MLFEKAGKMVVQMGADDGTDDGFFIKTGEFEIKKFIFNLILIVPKVFN